MRDSDKFTFENRVKEGFEFLERNHPGYRLYIFNEFGVDRRNCTADQIPNMQEFFAPAIVLAHAQWGVFAASMVLLNSRFGCFMAAIHAGGLAFFHNMHSVRGLILNYVTWRYSSGTPYYKKFSPCLPEKEFLESELHIDKSKAFGEEFMSKQKTWKCGIEYAVIEFLLCFFLV